jgi:acyl-CoA thioesterase-2
MSTVDHAIWFHEPARADEWLLFAQQSPKAARARGFVRGTIYSSDRRLVASVGQDSLMRPESVAH